MNFVLIHIGTNLRDYINNCIDQITLTNPTANVWVLLHRSESQKVRLLSNVRLVELEAIPISLKHRSFQENYRSPLSGPLWRFSTERFFYLETFMEIYNLRNVIHMEYDNMIYKDMSLFLPIFKVHYSNKMGCTFDADTRGIAGVMFVDTHEPMNAFTNFILTDKNLNKTDMEYLALFKDYDTIQKWIIALPIVPPNYARSWSLKNNSGHTVKNPSMFSNLFLEFQCVFDAAAVGQYLGGIDPLHNRPNSIGFINETTVFQCNNLKFEWAVAENGHRLPWMICGEERVPIVNLHVHCKNLSAFRS
jgi:hypothetical protein